MKPILLLRPDRAGDAVKTLPVLRALVARRKDLEIHLLASLHNASLFTHEPGIVLHTTLPANKFSVAVSLLSDRFDYAVKLLESTTAEEKFGVGKGDYTTISLPGGTSAGRSETLNVAHLVGTALKTDLLADCQRFDAIPFFDDADEEEADRKLGRKTGDWIAVCPFASQASRAGRHSRWRRFLKSISRREPDSVFFVFGSPGDEPAMRALCAHLDNTRFVSASSFRALGACLKRMQGVVAVESGPLHLAKALGIPSLGVFGRANLARWYLPLGPNDRVLERGRVFRYPTSWEMRRAYGPWRAASGKV